MAKKTEAQIQKDLINLRGENDAKHHEMKMEELEYIRKTEAQIQKDLINLRGENDAKHHEMKMEELEYIRKTEEIHHDHEMSRQSIKTAEIKKAFERKQASQYLRKQW